MSNDAQKLQDAAFALHAIWGAPCIIIVVLVLLWYQVGAVFEEEVGNARKSASDSWVERSLCIYAGRMGDVCWPRRHAHAGASDR